MVNNILINIETFWTVELQYTEHSDTQKADAYSSLIYNKLRIFTLRVS